MCPPPNQHPSPNAIASHSISSSSDLGPCHPSASARSPLVVSPLPSVAATATSSSCTLLNLSPAPRVMRTASRPSATLLRFRSPVVPVATASGSLAPSITRAALSCSALNNACISPSAVTCSHIAQPSSSALCIRSRIARAASHLPAQLLSCRIRPLTVVSGASPTLRAPRPTSTSCRRRRSPSRPARARQAAHRRLSSTRSRAVQRTYHISHAANVPLLTAVTPGLSTLVHPWAAANPQLRTAPALRPLESCALRTHTALSASDLPPRPQHRSHAPLAFTEGSLRTRTGALLGSAPATEAADTANATAHGCQARTLAATHARPQCAIEEVLLLLLRQCDSMRQCMFDLPLANSCLNWVSLKRRKPKKPGGAPPWVCSLGRASRWSRARALNSSWGCSATLSSTRSTA
eukprot:5945710-Prymnesium_polylepis.1